MTDINGVDQALIQGYLDSLGAATVGQMLDLYVQQSSVYLTEIEQALQAQSQERWHARCHKMKGAAASVGLVNVHRHLVAIEHSTDSWSDKQGYLAELITLNSQSVTNFRQLLASL